VAGSLFEPVIEALEQAGVRYVVVGGLAVVLHGHARLTADVDIAVDLAPDQAALTMETLGGIGLRPRAPVRADDFADPEARSRWRAEKGMQVLSLWDPEHPMRAVDLFVENPVDFDELWNRSETVQLETTRVRIASIPDLIDMKEQAGRPQDVEDIAALREILLTKEGDGG
jgi:predicted nucleotidyltransferase